MTSPNLDLPMLYGFALGEMISCHDGVCCYRATRRDTEQQYILKVISIPQNDGDIDEMYNDGYDDESITSTFQSHLKSIVAEYSLMRKMNGCTNIVNCDDIRYIQHEDGIGWDIFIKMELLM